MQPPLVARLVAAIEADILEGRLKPGQRLEEVVLSQRFGVSRTPVREALRQLAAARLVDLQLRLGAVVARPTAGEVIELFEVVAELEGVATSLAALRMSDDDRAAISSTHRDCRTSAGGDNAEDYYLANSRFHRAIHSASQNQVLVETIAMLDKRIAPYRRFITFRPDRTEAALREHDAIFAALMEQNCDAARGAMVKHVRVLADDAVLLVKGLSLR